MEIIRLAEILNHRLRRDGRNDKLLQIEALGEKGEAHITIGHIICEGVEKNIHEQNLIGHR